MLKETKTKIMVQVWDVVAQAIRRDLLSLHVTRDAYLNTLLKHEIEELAAEITFSTPAAARRRVKLRLRDLNAKPTTIALDRDVAKRIRQVLKAKNISRDAFINRVLFFLVAKPVHLRRLGIDYDQRQRVEVKPLGDAWAFLHDPFANIRISNNGDFYKIQFPDEPLAKNWPNLFGLNCAISDETWKLSNTPFDLLLGELGLGTVSK